MAKALEKVFTVSSIQEDFVFFNAPGNDMMECPGRVYA
jgi:hypothetical protein